MICSLHTLKLHSRQEGALNCGLGRNTSALERTAEMMFSMFGPVAIEFLMPDPQRDISPAPLTVVLFCKHLSRIGVVRSFGVA